MTDMMIQTPQGEMEMRLQEQEVVFVKKRTGEEPIRREFDISVMVPTLISICRSILCWVNYNRSENEREKV